MNSDPGARPFGNQGPPKITAPKRAARSAGSKAAPKSGTSRQSRAQDDSEAEEEPENKPSKGDGKPEPKRKKAKTDPRVAAKLAELEVEKDVILTSDKWSERVKNLNIEATQSIEVAKSYPETKGFPGETSTIFSLLLSTGLAISTQQIPTCGQ